MTNPKCPFRVIVLQKSKMLCRLPGVATDTTFFQPIARVSPSRRRQQRLDRRAINMMCVLLLDRSVCMSGRCPQHRCDRLLICICPVELPGPLQCLSNDCSTRTLILPNLKALRPWFPTAITLTFFGKPFSFKSDESIIKVFAVHSCTLRTGK
jgi:hypothetical protein